MYCFMPFFSLSVGVTAFVVSITSFGAPILIIQLMIPYIIATSFFALACSVFFSDSDAPLLMIAFFSVGLIFLQGFLSAGINAVVLAMDTLFDSCCTGYFGFRENKLDGSRYVRISQQYIIYGCNVGYFILACLAYRYNMKKHFLLHSIFSLRLSQYNKSLLFCLS